MVYLPGLITALARPSGALLMAGAVVLGSVALLGAGINPVGLGGCGAGAGCAGSDLPTSGIGWPLARMAILMQDSSQQTQRS